MHTKSQVTIFIVIGIIILGIIALLISMQWDVREAHNTLPSQEPISHYVTNCLELVGNDGLYIIGLQGGLIEPSPLNLNTNISAVAYHYMGQESFSVPLETMETELSNYIEYHIHNCISDFEVFREQGYEFEYTIAEVSTIATEDTVDVDMDFPISVRKDGRTATISDFNVQYNVRLKKIQSFVQGIVESLLTDSKNIDITYMKESGFAISMLPVLENGLIFIVIDDESSLQNQPYYFLFAAEFSNLGGET